MSDKTIYEYDGFEIHLECNPLFDTESGKVYRYSIRKGIVFLGSGLVTKEFMEYSAIDWRKILIQRHAD